MAAAITVRKTIGRSASISSPTGSRSASAAAWRNSLSSGLHHPVTLRVPPLLIGGGETFGHRALRVPPLLIGGGKHSAPGASRATPPHRSTPAAISGLPASIPRQA